MELEATISFVAVPQAEGFPDAILVETLLDRKELTANPGEFAGKVEDDARIDAGYEKFIGAELGDESDAMRVFGAGCGTSVVLREAESDSGLPGAKIELLGGLALFFDGGFQFAVEIELGDFAIHGAD